MYIIIACYNDNKRIPIPYRSAVFQHKIFKIFKI